MKLSMCGLGLSCLLAAACSDGSSSPSSPSARAATSVAPSVAVTSVTSGTFAMFGASSADLARCLSGVADAACFSGARPVVRVVTAGAAAPGAPGSLTATSSGSTVTLTWSAPTSGDPVVTYIIEAGSASGLSNLAVVTTGSTATTFTAGGVGNGTYYVRIKAQNATGTSVASSEAILVVGPAACTSAPDSPTGFTSTVTGSTVTLRWSAPSGGCAATSYFLQAGPTAGSNAYANDNVGNVTTFVASNVGTGFYYIRVVASNAYGTSAASNEVLTTVGNPTITLDLQPRSVALGTVDECFGGTLTTTLTVSAPPTVSWTVNAPGSDFSAVGKETLSRKSGTGSGTFTVTFTHTSRTPIAHCNSTVFNFGDTVTVFFSTGPFISSSLSYKFISVL